MKYIIKMKQTILHYTKYIALQPILGVLFFFTLIGCIDERKPEKFPQYGYAVDTYIPDSIRPKYADWVQKTVSAASYHMSGGDYEDPEDVIEQAEETGKRLFQVKTEGLNCVYQEGSFATFIPKENLTPEQLIILENFKK